MNVMIRLIVFVSLALIPAMAASQAADSSLVPEAFGLARLTEYLGLKPDDISFRADYTEPDSFRLAVVAGLMKRPLGMIDYAASLKDAHLIGRPDILAGILFDDFKRERQLTRSRPYKADVSELQRQYNLYYNDVNFNQLLTRAALYLDLVFPRSAEKSLALLTPAERAFLKNEFRELVVVRPEEEFYSVEASDSLDKAEEGFTDAFLKFGTKIDKDPIVAAGVDCLRELLPEINNLRHLIETRQLDVNKLLEGLGYLPKNADPNSYLGKQDNWKIGGLGNDYYKGSYKFILDFGGDDVYDLTSDPGKPQSTIIIDLGGNDSYRGKSDNVLGSGFFSVGLLLDFGGNDRYDGKSFSLGSGYFGMGLLYDAGGDDQYSGDTHVEGAGTYGLGLLIDEGGRDIYNAAMCAQGFGFVEGIGVLYETAGNDSYYAGGKYKDILRYEDHYLSLSQGFGYGLNPRVSGGIGALVDLAGHDNYSADILAQGAGFWWSLGVLYDSSGNDNYQAYQYAQGSGTHMALGILVDDWGNDVYYGKGLMQGCGHDYACGLILDRHGNDTYVAYDLSQAGGSANGAGVLIDNEGDDRYFVKNPKNTQGYGQMRRDFGSIGLFIDLGGSDQYLGNGADNYYWQEGMRGGGMDIELKPKDSAQAKP